jgi:hypothetical protein
MRRVVRTLESNDRRRTSGGGTLSTAVDCNRLQPLKWHRRLTVCDLINKMSWLKLNLQLLLTKCVASDARMLRSGIRQHLGINCSWHAKFHQNPSARAAQRRWELCAYRDNACLPSFSFLRSRTGHIAQPIFTRNGSFDEVPLCNCFWGSQHFHNFLRVILPK